MILSFTDKKGAGLQILAEFGDFKALHSSWLARQGGRLTRKLILRIEMTGEMARPGKTLVIQVDDLNLNTGTRGGRRKKSL